MRIVSRMLEFCVLGSGSRGNCVYVADGDVRVLIDCGLSARQTEVRLRAIGVEPESVAALLVSHEHNDHMAGVRIFSRRFGALIYANQAVLAATDIAAVVPQEQVREFVTGTGFSVGSLLFEPFSISHDAVDPVGFKVRSNSSSLAVLTDLGHVTALVRERVRDVDALLLEFNHDPDLLNVAPYPWSLKQRIRGRKGHLSNESAAQLVVELAEGGGEKLQMVVAMHVSEKSNDPGVVVETFRNAWRSTTRIDEPAFVVAAAHAPTEVYRI